MTEKSDRQKCYNVEICNEHRAANSYGLPLNFSLKCKCCCKIIDKKPFQMSFEIQNLYYCGSGIPLYLTTINYLLVVSLTIALTVALGGILLNYISKGCQNLINCNNCLLINYSFVSALSNNTYLGIESLLNIVGYFLIILFVQLLRKKSNKIIQEINQTNFHPSKYGVLIDLQINNAKNESILGEIETWWKKQLKFQKKSLIEIFPELYQFEMQERLQNINQISDIDRKNMKRSVLQNKIVQKILISYNYQQFLEFKSQIEILQKQIAKSKKHQRVKQQLSSQSKKLFLQKLSKNTQRLVIFKNKKYAQYFYKKTNCSFLQQFFCFEHFRVFEFEGKQVKTIGYMLPSEIVWENHHKTKEGANYYRFALLLCFFLSACSFGVFYLFTFFFNKWILNSGLLIQQYYSSLLAFTYYICLKFFEFLIVHFSTKNIFTTKYEQQILTVQMLIFVNIFSVIFVPFLNYTLFFNEHIWAKNGIVQFICYFMLFYLFSNHLTKYLNYRTIKSLILYKLVDKKKNLKQIQANKIFQKPYHKIEQQYSWMVSSLFITLFFTPFVPFIFILFFLSNLLQLILQRTNIAYFYSETHYFGSILHEKIITFIERSGLFLILGSIAVSYIAVKQLSSPISNMTIISNSILLTLQLVLFLIPISMINSKLFCSAKNSKEKNQQLLECLYSEGKENFLVSFEQSNPVYQYFQKENIKLTQTSNKTKIIQQMLTMSKTLSISIKERLFSNQPSVLNHADRLSADFHEEQSEIGDLYFEYEKKINMPKSITKITVPPIFKKEQNCYNKQVDQEKRNVVNIFSAFSEDDETGKKQLKDIIKKKVKQNMIAK